MKHDKYHVSTILIVGVIAGAYSAIGAPGFTKLAPYFRPDCQNQCVSDKYM
jgi:hypothetical protein